MKKPELMLTCYKVLRNFHNLKINFTFLPFFLYACLFLPSFKAVQCHLAYNMWFFSAKLDLFSTLTLSINFIQCLFACLSIFPSHSLFSFSFFSSPEIDFLHRFKISLSDWIFCRNRWDRWTKVTTKTKTLIAFHQFFFCLKKGKQSFLISA